MDILKEVKGLEAELIQHRRYLHQNAEVGFHLPKTRKYIQSELEKLGFYPQKCGKAGITVALGEGEEVLLLRADMDALPIRESTGLPFACENGNMHACGHDLHAAMLLGAAKLLKREEKKLRRKVRLLFQPAEEQLEGANDCIKDGVLKNVSKAFSMHVATGVSLPIGTVILPPEGVGAPASNFFEIKITGEGCHGASPWNGVDSLMVASTILLALQTLSAREFSPEEDFVLTIGGLEGANSENVIPNVVILKGTLRSFDETVQNRVKIRMWEMVKGIAKGFRAQAKISYISGCPPLKNDREMILLLRKNIESLLGNEFIKRAKELQGERRSFGGSEDFSYIAKEVPSAMISIVAGGKNKGCSYPLHHPKVCFDEKVLPIGCALYVKMALN